MRAGWGSSSGAIPCAERVKFASDLTPGRSRRGPGSGPEQGIELRVQAGRGANPVLVPEPEAAGTVSRFHLELHLGVTGEVLEDRLQLLDQGGAELRRVHLEHDGAEVARRTRLGNLVPGRLEDLDLLDEELGFAPLLVVEPAADDQDRVNGNLVASIGEDLAEDQHLDLALDVVEGGEHHRVAALRPDPLALGDYSANRDDGPVGLVLEPGQRAI